MYCYLLAPYFFTDAFPYLYLGSVKAWSLPPGSERHPAVLVAEGSNGGVPSRPAAWLASRGFVTLALAYFH